MGIINSMLKIISEFKITLSNSKKIRKVKSFKSNPTDYQLFFNDIIRTDSIYQNENIFLLWWDSNEFDWKHLSGDLSIRYSKFFDIWWDPDKFNWNFLYVLKSKLKHKEHIWKNDYILMRLCK